MNKCVFFLLIFYLFAMSFDCYFVSLAALFYVFYFFMKLFLVNIELIYVFGLRMISDSDGDYSFH